MCHEPIKFMLRSNVLLQNRPNQHFIIETVFHEFLLSYNCLICHINQLVIILIGHFRMREIIAGNSYLSNLYEHWLWMVQPMEFFKTSFYERVVGGLLDRASYLFSLTLQDELLEITSYIPWEDTYPG